MTDAMRFANETLRVTQPNIDALRAGRKTQTRRPVTPQPKRVGDRSVDIISAKPCKYTIGQRLNVVTPDDVDTGITIEITGICIQRLSDISEADAIAEGMVIPDDEPDVRRPTAARWAFHLLWGTIYGPDSPYAWERNTFVWVYQFTVTAATQGGVM